jgi:hypothetical protein
MHAGSAEHVPAFERAYPGTASQPRHVRADLAAVADGCPGRVPWHDGRLDRRGIAIIATRAGGAPRAERLQVLPRGTPPLPLRSRSLRGLLVTGALVNTALSATEVGLIAYVRHHHALWAAGPLLAAVSAPSFPTPTSCRTAPRAAVEESSLPKVRRIITGRDLVRRSLQRRKKTSPNSSADTRLSRRTRSEGHTSRSFIPPR